MKWQSFVKEALGSARVSYSVIEAVLFRSEPWLLCVLLGRQQGDMVLRLPDWHEIYHFYTMPRRLCHLIACIRWALLGLDYQCLPSKQVQTMGIKWKHSMLQHGSCLCAGSQMWVPCQNSAAGAASTD